MQLSSVLPLSSSLCSLLSSMCSPIPVPPLGAPLVLPLLFFFFFLWGLHALMHVLHSELSLFPSLDSTVLCPPYCAPYGAPTVLPLVLSLCSHLCTSSRAPPCALFPVLPPVSLPVPHGHLSQILSCHHHLCPPCLDVLHRICGLGAGAQGQSRVIHWRVCARKSRSEYVN
jgi:hypothetical protein